MFHYLPFTAFLYTFDKKLKLVLSSPWKIVISLRSTISGGNNLAHQIIKSILWSLFPVNYYQGEKSQNITWMFFCQVPSCLTHLWYACQLKFNTEYSTCNWDLLGFLETSAWTCSGYSIWGLYLNVIFVRLLNYCIVNDVEVADGTKKLNFH